MNHLFNKYFEKVLVLTTNHEFSKERRERIKSRLNGIDYSFFYGVSYEDLDIQSYYDNGCQLAYPGQIGCSESFNMIYQHIVDNNIESCLILEDDACINDENLKVMDKVFDQLPEDWQLFYLGYGHQDVSPPPNYSSNLIKIDKNGHFYPDSTIGFAVKKEYAKILHERNNPVTWTADANLQLTFRNTDCIGYASVPKIIFPEGKDSVVENKIL